MHLPTYIGLLYNGEGTLASSYRQVADGHVQEIDLYHTLHRLARECDRHVGALTPLRDRYGANPANQPERLHAEGIDIVRSGGLGLLRDLHDLYLLAHYLDIAWILVGQAGQGERDRELIEMSAACEGEISKHAEFLKTRLKQSAPQALLVAD